VEVTLSCPLYPLDQPVIPILPSDILYPNYIGRSISYKPIYSLPVTILLGTTLKEWIESPKTQQSCCGKRLHTFIRALSDNQARQHVRTTDRTETRTKLTSRAVGGVVIAGGVGSIIHLTFSSIIIGVYEIL
jgi:hypothetical protein